MEPYQAANEEMRRRGEQPVNALKAAGSLALSAAPAYAGAKVLGGIGTKIGERVKTFLNDYIPQDLAIKGLSKIDPRLGKFVKKAMDEGYDFDELKNFIKEKTEEKQPLPKENRNIIEQYSPELHQFIHEQVQRGRSALQAGAAAQGMSKFSEIIKKLTKDHKLPWSNILESVYGDALAPQGSQASSQQQTNSFPQEKAGPGNQALMEILQKIQKAKGGVQ